MFVLLAEQRPNGTSKKPPGPSFFAPLAQDACRQADHEVENAAVKIARIGIGEEGDQPGSEAPRNAAAELGKLGGAARARKLTAEKRAEIARKAAAKRWEASRVAAAHDTCVDPTHDSLRTQSAPITPQRRSAGDSHSEPKKWKLLRTALKRISPEQRALIAALPGMGGLTRCIRLVLTAKTKAELDDSDLLLRIEQRRRRQPDLKLKTAIKEVINELVGKDKDTTRSGDKSVQLAERRFVSVPSALRHLQKKYAKHQDEIRRRADSIEFGGALAHRHVAPIVAAGGASLSIRIPFGSSQVAAPPPCSSKRAMRLPEWLDLGDAAKAVQRETMAMIRRQRSGE
jgi:hypothetical protein